MYEEKYCHQFTIDETYLLIDGLRLLSDDLKLEASDDPIPQDAAIELDLSREASEVADRLEKWLEKQLPLRPLFKRGTGGPE